MHCRDGHLLVLGWLLLGFLGIPVVAAEPSAIEGQLIKFAPPPLHGRALLLAGHGDMVVAVTQDPAARQNIYLAGWDGQQWHRLSENRQQQAVRALVWYDGAYILAGSKSGLAQCRNGAWSPFAPEIEGAVHSLCVRGSDLFVGGRFVVADSIQHLVRYDGERWHPVGACPAGGGFPRVLHIADHGDDLVIGGVFTSIGSVPARNIAAWDGVSWRALGEGLHHWVNRVAVIAGRIHAATAWSGGSMRDSVRVWGFGPDHDWSPLGRAMWARSRYMPGGKITGMIDWRGQPLIGGFVSPARNDPASCLALWDGERWQAWPAARFFENWGFEATERVESVLVHHGRLYVGGSFDVVGETWAKNITCWDGDQWSGLGRGTGINGQVQSFAGSKDDMYVCGRFSNAGPLSVRDLVHWHDGQWTRVAALPESLDFRRGNNRVTKLAIYQGRLVAATNQGAIYRLTDSWQRLDTDWPCKFDHIHRLVATDSALLVHGSGVRSGSPSLLFLFAAETPHLLEPPEAMGSIIHVEADDGQWVFAGEQGRELSRQATIWRCDGSTWQQLWAEDGSSVSSLCRYGEDLLAAVRWRSGASRVIAHDGSGWRTWAVHDGAFAVDQLHVYDGQVIAVGSASPSYFSRSIRVRSGETWCPLWTFDSSDKVFIDNKGGSLWFYGGMRSSWLESRWDGPLPDPQDRCLEEVDHLPALDPSDPEFLPGDKLRNPLFSRWHDGRPEHWLIRTNAAGSKWRQILTELPHEGVALPALVEHQISLSQRFRVADGQFLQLRILGQRLPGEDGASGAVSNCHLHLWPTSQAANGLDVSPVSGSLEIEDEIWRWHELNIFVPTNFSEAELAIDPGHDGGRLRLKQIQIQPANISFADCLDTLITELEQRYAHWFSLPAVWRERVEVTRDKLQAHPRNDRVFREHVSSLLASLGDRRLTLSRHWGQRLFPRVPDQREESIRCRQAWVNLDGEGQKDLWGTVSWLEDGICYLSRHVPHDLTVLDWQTILAASGLILDLRDCSGSWDVFRLWQESLFSRLTETALFYGTRRGHGSVDSLYIQPGHGDFSSIPVVAIIDAWSEDDGVQLAMACKALPRVRLVGRSTSGVYVSQGTLRLAEGTTVQFPVGRFCLPDGTPVTDFDGVRPDVEVPAEADCVKVLAIAVEQLRALIHDLVAD